MKKNKYIFIKELLNSNLTKTQQDKIIALSSRELEKDKYLEERVEKIEGVVFGKKGNNKVKTHLPKEMVKYIYPSSLYKFLYAYNQDEVLKTTCHAIDSDNCNRICELCNTEIYNFSEHLALIEKHFEALEKKYFAPYQVKALIRAYLTGKRRNGEEANGWTSEEIKINWASPKLLEWSKNNQGVPPNIDKGFGREKKNKGFELDQPIRSAYTARIENFTELTIHFKHLFHIRYDNSLLKVLENRNEQEKWGNKIDFQIDNFAENVEIFTDVDKLVQAYDRFIDLILEVSKRKGNKPQIKLSLKQEQDFVIFSIHHLNSVYGHTIEDTKKRIGNTYTNLIKKQLNGLCEFYIKADFGQKKYAEINIWNGEDRKEKMIPEFKGVQYILKIPQK